MTVRSGRHTVLLPDREASLNHSIGDCNADVALGIVPYVRPSRAGGS